MILKTDNEGYANAQADLNLRCPYMLFRHFMHIAAENDNEITFQKASVVRPAEKSTDSTS